MSWDDGWTTSGTSDGYRYRLVSSTASTSAMTSGGLWTVIYADSSTVGLAGHARQYASTTPTYDRAHDEREVRALHERRVQEACEAFRWPEHERRKRLKEAGSRAFQLLFRCLPRDQAERLGEQGHFDVQGSQGGWYRIREGQYRNVLRLNRGCFPVEQLCLHPVDWCPNADVMLAQRLLLQTDEGQFLRQANRTSLNTFWM